MHWAAAGVSAPKTASQKWAQALVLARRRPGNSEARIAPVRVPPMRRRAWRREVEVAKALVTSSNFDGSISVRSFPGERVAHPRARSARGARIVIADA